MERAFEPFFTTKEIGKGSGLGLAQVYGVATQFGGTVRIASEPGVGTTVQILLPRALEEQDAVAASEPHAADTQGDGGTVLVVDDDAEVRDLAAIFLREAGYAVREAGSGPEARDIVSTRPDLARTRRLRNADDVRLRVRTRGASEPAKSAGGLRDRCRRCIWNRADCRRVIPFS